MSASLSKPLSESLRESLSASLSESLSEWLSESPKAFISSPSSLPPVTLRLVPGRGPSIFVSLLRTASDGSWRSSSHHALGIFLIVRILHCVSCTSLDYHLERYLLHAEVQHMCQDPAFGLRRGLVTWCFEPIPPLGIRSGLYEGDGGMLINIQVVVQ